MNPLMLAAIAVAGFTTALPAAAQFAKPEIWAEKDKFMAGATKMQEEVAKLSAIAKGGDLGQIKSAFGAVGQACKACHDNYQKPL